MKRRTIIAAGVAVGGLALSLLAAGSAQAHPAAGPTTARADAYLLPAGQTLNAHDSVLDNDTGAPATLISHTAPAHGTLTMNQDGTFTYVPAPGFSGVDTFTYTVNDAVKLYNTNLPPLATIGGVNITGGGYGSSLAPVPGSNDEYYGLTDRGPNVTAPDASGLVKIEPLPNFDPAIGKFKLVGTQAVLEKTIPLRAADGSGYNGLVNSQASTGETIENLNGTPLAPSPNGYDSEGLVALPDGTFWVSDEYGPFITHFDRSGRQIGRLSPFDGSLPAELAQRVPNKGMEGLTITPDGSTLVGMMQSALQTPDVTADKVKVANITTLRIVTYNLKTKVTHEYIYLLTDPKTNSGAVSEITALSSTKFVVDERDGNFENDPTAFKELYAIDISKATDVGPKSTVAGATYVAAKGGLLVGPKQQSIDDFVTSAGKALDTADSAAALVSVGITPVGKVLDVDLSRLIRKLDPTGDFFGHDKVEGVATTDGGKTLVVSNDSDFGIDGVTQTTVTPPYTLHPKILPNGTQDDGQFLAVDTTKLNDPNSTATVSIFVTPHDIHTQH